MWMLSFKEFHEMAGRAIPAKIRDYKTALQLYKTVDLQIPHTDWINLNLNAVYWLNYWHNLYIMPLFND